MMRLLFFALLLVFAGAARAEDKPPPTPAQIAFARLPADIRERLAGMSAEQAMQTVAQARQQAIALGMPNPTHEQFRATLGAVLSDSTYTGGASAGATSFPPLSPLVPPPPPPFLR